MDFGSFVSAFGKGYRALRDNETGEALGKEMFCRELLCAIAKHDKYVKYVDGITDSQHVRTKQAFYAYYRNGTQRRSLHPIAMFIVNSLDVDKFHNFLVTYVQNNSKEQLFNQFHRYLPQTSMETLFSDITKEFCDIITAAANETDKRQHSPLGEDEASSKLSGFVSIDNPTMLRESLDCLLQELKKWAMKLCFDSLEFSSKYDKATLEERKVYDQTICDDHSAFAGLNETLLLYTIKMPDFRQLKDLLSSGNCWALDFFRPWENPSSLEMPAELMKYYLELWNKANAAVPTYFECSSSDE